MGAKDSNSISEVQQQYKDKIKEQIAKVWPFQLSLQRVTCRVQPAGTRPKIVQKAAELEAREEAGREEFNFGVALYERGRYAESESMLKTALDVAGMPLLGGLDFAYNCAEICVITQKGPVLTNVCNAPVMCGWSLQALSRSLAGTFKFNWRSPWLPTEKRRNA
jgi:hypothetical protein